jgi:aminoglycoside 3-N-acetyltransferase
MTNQLLFISAQGKPVTSDGLRAALEDVRAHDCNVLYMHTGLSFGRPNPDLRRADLLDAIYQAVRSTGVATLCVPTYTFSFCNNEDYDSGQSRSRMGALNEYIRRRPEAVRSADPLMSVAVVGEDIDLVENLGRESIGKNSTFDKLRKREGVKFLFLGVGVGDCFTYMHYLEWIANVPYRYSREFSGTITHKGESYIDTYKLFVRYNNVHPNSASYLYERMLEDRELLRVAPIGDTSIRCMNEHDARAIYLDLLYRNPNYFIEKPFCPDNADHRFVVDTMIAL